MLIMKKYYGVWESKSYVSHYSYRYGPPSPHYVTKCVFVESRPCHAQTTLEKYYATKSSFQACPCPVDGGAHGNATWLEAKSNTTMVNPTLWTWPTMVIILGCTSSQSVLKLNNWYIAIHVQKRHGREEMSCMGK